MLLNMCSNPMIFMAGVQATDKRSWTHLPPKWSEPVVREEGDSVVAHLPGTSVRFPEFYLSAWEGDDGVVCGRNTCSF